MRIYHLNIVIIEMEYGTIIIIFKALINLGCIFYRLGYSSSFNSLVNLLLNINFGVIKCASFHIFAPNYLRCLSTGLV